MTYMLAILSVFCWGCADAQAAEQEAPWFQRRLVGMEVGPTGAQWGSDPKDTGYCAQFNGRAIVEKQLAIGSEYLVLWARDGEWAYYDSELMPKCPGLGARDPLREAVEAAAPHGLPVIAYCVVQSGGHALRTHPEFAMVGADGKPVPGRVCLNSGYRGFVKHLLAEMLAYGVDGFHVDMVDQGFGPPYGCWCAVCRKRFEARYGSAMPDGATWDPAWDRMLEFRYDTSADFERDIRAFVRQIDEDASVDYNYHGYPPFSFEVGQRPVQHAHVGDFVTCESGTWAFGALSSPLTAEFVRATGPARRYQVVMQRGTRFYHDQTCRPLNDLRWEMFSLLAHGAQVTIVDKTPFSGALDPVAYGRIGDVFAEVARKRAHFGQVPLYDTALYYSHRARDWYGREQKEKYQHAFFGAHKAMAYAHIPAGVLLDESLSAEMLSAYPVVVLPNVPILRAAEVELLTAYVREGGNLVITGQTGCYDKYGAPAKASVLEELAGARLKKLMPDKDNYLRLDAVPAGLAALAADIPLDWPHLVYGPAAVYEATTATAHGALVAPVRRQRQKEGKEGTEFPSSAGEPVGPALLWNRVGQGTVLTLAVSPGAAAGSEYRTAESRRLLSNAARALRGHPAVEVLNAPAYADTVITDEPAEKTLRVHFAACVRPPGITEPKRPWVLPGLMEDVPLFRAKIRVRRPVAECSALNPATVIARDGPDISLTIEDVHETLVLEYESPSPGETE